MATARVCAPAADHQCERASRVTGPPSFVSRTGVGYVSRRRLRLTRAPGPPFPRRLPGASGRVAGSRARQFLVAVFVASMDRRCFLRRPGQVRPTPLRRLDSRLRRGATYSSAGATYSSAGTASALFRAPRSLRLRSFLTISLFRPPPLSDAHRPERSRYAHYRRLPQYHYCQHRCSGSRRRSAERRTASPNPSRAPYRQGGGNDRSSHGPSFL